jgi:hypothetical protein
MVPDNSVFYDGAACPAELGLGRPPRVRLFMEGMVWTKQGKDDVHIQQGAHGLHALLVLYFLDVVQRDNFAAGRQDRDTAVQTRAPFCRCRVQPTPCQVGNHLTGRAAMALRESLGRLQYVVRNVESRSHAFDANTLLHHEQELPHTKPP